MLANTACTSRVCFRTMPRKYFGMAFKNNFSNIQKILFSNKTFFSALGMVHEALELIVIDDDDGEARLAPGGSPCL